MDVRTYDWIFFPRYNEPCTYIHTLLLKEDGLKWEKGEYLWIRTHHGLHASLAQSCSHLFLQLFLFVACHVFFFARISFRARFPEKKLLFSAMKFPLFNLAADFFAIACFRFPLSDARWARLNEHARHTTSINVYNTIGWYKLIATFYYYDDYIKRKNETRMKLVWQGAAMEWDNFFFFLLSESEVVGFVAILLLPWTNIGKALFPNMS